MECLSDYCYSGINDGTKVHHFLHDIERTELDVVVNVIWAQPEKYGKNFDAMTSYLCQVVTKKGYNVKSIHIAKTGSQPAKPKVVSFMAKIECQKYLKAVWHSIFREQQMQVR